MQLLLTSKFKLPEHAGNRAGNRAHGEEERRRARKASRLLEKEKCQSHRRDESRER